MAKKAMFQRIAASLIEDDSDTGLLERVCHSKDAEGGIKGINFHR
jgi:hypothetical protein